VKNINDTQHTNIAYCGLETFVNLNWLRFTIIRNLQDQFEQNSAFFTRWCIKSYKV